MPLKAVSVIQSERFQVESCYAFLVEDELTIGNALIERKWEIKEGLLFNKALLDKTVNYNWFAGTSRQPSPYPGLAIVPGEIQTLQLTAQPSKRTVVEANSLRLELTATGETFKWIYQFQVYPASAGISIQVVVESLAVSAGSPEARSDSGLAEVAGQNAAPDGIEQDAPMVAEQSNDFQADVLEQFELADRHMRLRQITLQDQTDHVNELVFENEWLLHPSESIKGLQGNLFILENSLTGTGLIFLKLAPLPASRPVKSARDFEITQTRQTTNLALYGHGAGNEVGEGYVYTVLAYTGGRYTEVLQNYQRQLRTYNPDRDGLFLTNTWGDRSRDGRITEAFLEKEIVAAAALGADVIQIDDGWQGGTTANSVNKNGVWEGFWSANPNFWTPHAERLPNGLEPLIARAKEKGLQFGLWFAPDSTDDFINWQNDADILIGLYRRLGINYFKVDAIKLRTKKGEHNLEAFYKRVLEASQGEIVFDTDVTAEVRPGYFGQFSTGPIFIENRYTDWHNYWPHQTLRNLWKLTHYFDPLHTRIEFLNNARHTDLYLNDPLAPERYSPSYLFAVTMVSSPLGWFEVSNLSPGFSAEVASLVAIWKLHRQKLAQGIITPIGAAPDGTAWTGFASLNGSEREGYLLVFRELNDLSKYSFRLPETSGEVLSAEILWGNGKVSIEGNNAEVEIPAAQDFLFVRLKFS